MDVGGKHVISQPKKNRSYSKRFRLRSFWIRGILKQINLKYSRRKVGGALSRLMIATWLYMEARRVSVEYNNHQALVLKVLLSAFLASSFLLWNVTNLSISQWRQLKKFPLSLEASKREIAKTTSFSLWFRQLKHLS